MLFSSLTFLYAFLPLSLILYVRGRNIKQKNMILLISSLAFYAWGEPKYVLLLLAMSLADWFIARRLDWAKSARSRKIWLIAAIVLNLALIGFFKYSGLIASVFGSTPEFIENIALPLGISFYTFQLISYVVDVYRGDVAAKENALDVLLYASLFHQCIAGPIVRYNTIERELFVERRARDSIVDGVKRFSWGLGKKVILANACCEVADKLLLSDADIAGGIALADGIAQLAAAPVAGLWLGMLAYMLHIYLDFSAYSDMAIGLGLMLGLHYPENFDHPYMSKSVSEFWRRWHMSLGTFFRDYVYIPLGGSRRGTARTLLNLLIVWSLTGLWHGASWTFVIWGLYYFVFLALEKFGLRRFFERLPKPVSWLYTVLVVFFGWAIFKFTDLELLGTLLRGMFGLNGNALTSYQVTVLFKNNVLILLTSLVFCTPLFKYIGRRMSADAAKSRSLSIAYNSLVCCVIPVALLILSTSLLVGDSYNPFIYFNF